MAGKLLQSPVVERLPVGFKCEQVAGRQRIEAVRQPPPEAAWPLAQDDHVENLLLLRQILLQLDLKRRAGEEVGQEEAEESVPVNGVHCCPVPQRGRPRWLDRIP